MSLVKKTIVLTGGALKGFATVIKLGTSVGVKLNLPDADTETLIGIRIGSLPLIISKSEDKIKELNYDLDFPDDAPISITVVRQGKTYLSGGASGRLTAEEILKAFDELERTKVKATEKTETEALTSISTEPPIAEETPIVSPEETAAFEFFKAQTDNNFYIGVQDKIEELLTIYPRDEELEKLLPDSRIAKVNYDTDEFYTVGTLSDGGRVSHIIYGVRGISSLKPPKEVEGVSQFLPLNSQTDQGYWIILQDALTGETVKND